jgi:Homeodomain-like domain
MKAHHKTPQNTTFKPKPLSIEQRNAIALLILGKTDQETAAAVGVSRETVWSWRREHLVFQSELEQARDNLWRQAAERLRGLMDKALDNIQAAVEEGNVKASFELLKAVGIYGAAAINHIAEWRLELLIDAEVRRRIKAEGIAETEHDVLAMMVNQPTTTYTKRAAELRAELEATYGAPDE